MPGYILWFAVSMLFILFPFLGPALIPNFEMGAISQIIMMVVGLVSMVLLAIVVVITKLYVKAKANMAIVRTGMGGLKVIRDGGILYIPVIHQIIEVKMETMRLDVERADADALITADNLRADLKAEFYIKVMSNNDDIINAARSLGDRSMHQESIKQLVFDKLVNALRAVAAKSKLFDLHSQREVFAEEVKKAVTEDLAHNGLTLESVTISRLDQTKFESMDERNVFDAEGRKRIAEITQAARVETNRLEREAEEKVADQDVRTRKAVLERSLDRERAEAEQSRDVENARAASKKEADTFRIEQEQATEARELEKQEAIARRAVQKDREIEVAEQQKREAIIAAQKAQEVADIDRQKATEVATVEKQTAEEAARRDQQIAISKKEKERADAEAERLAAEAEREKNDQQVQTVAVVEKAKREKEQRVIQAQAEAETAYVSQQRSADAEAYTEQKRAEGRKAAAEADYMAKVKAAQAEQESAEKRAAGKKAEDMVPVQVAGQQVQVDRDREMIAVDVAEKQVAVDRQAVEVERQRLEQQDEYGRVAIEMELAKLTITKTAEVQVAQANAAARMMETTEATIFGSPDDLATMTEKFVKGMGAPMLAEGFLKALESNPLAAKAVQAVTSKLESLADAATDRLAGKDAPAETPVSTEPTKPAADPEAEDLAGENKDSK